MRAIGVLALWGCSYHPPTDPGSPVDSPIEIDAPMVEGDASKCFGTGYDVRFCLTALPTTDLSTTQSISIDTDGSACDASISAFCVIAATTVHVNSGHTVSAAGMRALIILSTSDLVIDGVLDVAAHVSGTPQRLAPAGDSAICNPPGTPTAHGGGAGGSLGTRGGNGGGVIGATAAAIQVPTTLRGGCPGSDGALAGSDRGHGGGAVYLIAQTIIVNANGVINASGESGHGTNNNGGGGGGGGSGGVIAFDTPSLTLGSTAKIFANGGGGGEGAGGNQSNDGVDATGPAAGGAGGAGGSTGGNGGNGGAGLIDGANGGPGGNANEGGGAGGGGAGVVKLFRGTVPNSGQVSPPFS